MARIAFEKIMAGLDDALAYADADALRGVAPVLLNSAEIKALFCLQSGCLRFIISSNSH